jgi:hypothetical protein
MIKGTKKLSLPSKLNEILYSGEKTTLQRKVLLPKGRETLCKYPKILPPIPTK